jgi:hypothetical protein
MPHRVEKPRVEKQFYTKLMDVYRRHPRRIPLLNRVILSILKAKARSGVGRGTRRARSHAEDINDWYKEHRFFFGFALLRSGTMFLASVLNRALPDHIILHEPNVNDYYYYTQAIGNEAAARAYVDDYRRGEIYFRMRDYRFDSYGEVNCFLRRHCKAIKECLPEARCFHLVRDGRDVLRSLVSRETLAYNDPVAPLVHPPPGDPYYEQWSSMSRFQRLCWLWQADNSFIRASLDHTIQFELLVSDYDYFKSELLDYVGLELDSDTWQGFVGRRTNRTPLYRMPPWPEWAPGEREDFERICGAEFVASGYSL